MQAATKRRLKCRLKKAKALAQQPLTWAAVMSLLAAIFYWLWLDALDDLRASKAGCGALAEAVATEVATERDNAYSGLMEVKDEALLRATQREAEASATALHWYHKFMEESERSDSCKIS